MEEKGLNDIKVGFAMTGSFCCISSIMPRMSELVSIGVDVTPIFSETLASTDTRFGKASYFIEKVQSICKKPVIKDIPNAEPIGSRKMFDALIIAPCTGNTIAKIANGITDTAVTMAAKAHLRNKRPLIISISTNDALGMNARNIAALMITKHIFIVPFSQDDHVNKENSIISDAELILPTLFKALYENNQLQPVLN